MFGRRPLLLSKDRTSLAGTSNRVYVAEDQCLHANRA